MRKAFGRSVAGLVLVTASLLATSACGALPPGADGDLTNQWAAMADPKSWRPDEGLCSDAFRDVSYRLVFGGIAAIHVGTRS